MFNNPEFLISQYGQNVTLNSSDKNNTPKTFKAFIQPLRSDFQSDLYGDYKESDNTEQFLYIGPPGIQLMKYPTGTTLESNSEKFIIKKAENVYLSGEIIYERGLLEKAST